MRSENIQKSVIYRFRHLFVFALLIALATTLITYKFWILPNGLSAAEMASLTQSGHFSPALLLSNFSEHLDWIVDLPWTIMQWLSLQVFGISTFALRLPAVFLGILSAVGFILVLRKWFMTNVAMATAMLAITSPIFISIARSGSSSIMTVFLSVVALYAATVILYSNSDKVGLKSLLAKVSASIAMALLLYSPGGIYLAAVFVFAGLLHPKVRLLFVRTKIWKILVGIFLGIAILAPLIIGIMVQIISGDFDITREVFALGGAMSIDNSKLFIASITGLWSGAIYGFVTPLATSVMMALALIGLVRTCADFFSARSYLVLPMLLAAVLLSISNPQLLHVMVVPLILLTGTGIEVLLDHWLGLFPRNPYARLVGAIPITILILSASCAAVSRYVNVVYYNTAAVYSYNQEFQATVDALQNTDGKVNVVVADQQINLYSTLQNASSDISVSSEFSDDATDIVVNSAKLDTTEIPQKIVTTFLSKESVLLRIY